MDKKTQGTIDLKLGVNAELEALSVKSAKFSKEVQKQVEKIGPLEVDSPVKLSKRTMDRLSTVAADLRKGVQEALKKSNTEVDFSIGIAKAIQAELKQSSALLTDGKLVKTSLAKFIKDAGNISAAEAKKAVGPGGLLEPLIGKTKTQASSFLTEQIKGLKADKDKLASAYSEIAKTIRFGESQLRTLSTGLTSKTEETTAHIKALAEAMDLITNPRKSTLSKGIATDIDLVSQRVNTLKKGLTALAALSARAMEDPNVAYEVGRTPEELAKKTDDITRALKQERSELEKLSKSQRDAKQASERLAQARERLKQARESRKTYIGGEEQTRLRLLKEEYAAAMSLDKLQGKSVSRRTEALQRAIAGQSDNIKGLAKEAAAIQKVLEGREKLAASAKLGADKEISAHKQLINTILSTRSVLKGMYDEEASALQRNLGLLETRNKQVTETSKLQKDLAQARGLREGYTGGDEKFKLKLLQDEYAAAYRLDKLNKDANFTETEDVGKRLEGHKAELEAYKDMEAARKKVRAAKEDITLSSGFGRDDRLRALERYRAALRDTQAVLGKVNQAELASVDLEISRLEKAIQLRKIRSGIAGVKESADAGDTSSLQKRIRLNQQLEQVSGKSRADKISADQKALETTKKLTAAEQKQADALDELRAKVSAYNAAVKGLSNQDLSLAKWKELTATIDDYGRSIKRAKSIKGGITNTELQTLVSGYTKLGAGVRDVAEWQAKWNEAASAYNFALEPKARLKAANEMATALSGKSKAMQRSGQATFLDVAQMTSQSDAVQEIIKRQKELVIANNQAASSYNSLNGVMRSFFRYAVEFSLLYRAQQSIIDMVSSVVQLEDALKATQAISRSTDAEMQNVSASVEQVAIDTEYSTNEIAAAAQTLAQAGVDIREVGDALEYVAMAASATNSSIATTTDIMTTMMNVFKDMSFQEIADQMTATINLSKLTGDELSTILSRAVEVSDTFNIVPEQMNAAFAVLRNSGIKASTISTGYRQALLEVFSPDEKTLRFLEKRYAGLGQNMSQGTIAAMFQGFARSEDPIRAVTEELEKLGYSTSAAAEFARVFDVRATNVLDVLVKQRDEYIKLTTQIDNHGAALKGNQTQMESLSKSFENLGSIVTVVANDAFGGMLGTLEKIVDNIGTIIQNGGKAVNILRENTGSSGIGAALGAGALGGISRYMKTGSIASALGRGTGIAAVTETLQVALGSMGNKLTDTISELVGAVGVAVTAAGMLPKNILKRNNTPQTAVKSDKSGSKAALPGKRGIASKALDSVEEIASDPKTGLAATLASNLMDMVTTAVGWIKHLPKAFMAIGPAGWIATAGAALYTAMQMLDRDISVQIDAIRSRVEEANKNVKKLQDEATGNQKDIQQVQELTTSVDESQRALGDFFRAGSEGLDKTNEQIVDATNALDGVSFDLGSSGLADGLKRLQERLGVLFSPTMDQRDIINQINKTKAEVDKVEGNRAAWQQQLLEAYEADAAGRTKQQQTLIKTFESFSAAEKASIGGRIRDLNQAKKYLDLAGRLSQAKDTGLQTALSAEQGAVEKGNRDIARLEVQKSIKETGGLGGLTKLILQASKDGNAQLISDLRAEVVNLASNRSEASKGILPALNGEVPSFGKLDKQPTLQLLDEVQANAARESAQNMADHIAELEKQTAAQVDAFRNALTPDQAKSLGLPQSAIQEAEKATAKFLEGVPDEWKSAYNNAIGMNRTTAQSLEYLDKTKEKLGDFPPAIQKEYETLQKRAKVQESYLEAANQAAKDLAELGQKGEGLRREQDTIASEIKSLQPRFQAGDPIAATDMGALLIRQQRVKDQFDQFEKDYAIKAVEFKNKTAAAGTPILDKERTLAGIERTYKAQDNLNKSSESKRLLLEDERNRLAELDNQDRIRNLDLNTKIYNLRVSEAKRIEDTARDSLMSSTELSKAMGHTAKSYQEIADWFNGPEGQDFLEQHPNEAHHLAKLTEAVKDQELARRELTQRIIDEAQAIDQRLARDTQVVELKSQVESRTLDQQTGMDQAKTSAEETRIVLDGLKARQDLELKASDEKIGLLQEQAKAGRVTQLELTKVTQQELDKQLQSRKDYLSQALAEEKKHIDNIRNLKQSLKDNANNERDFANQFNRQAAINQGMGQADALQFDRNVAGQSYNMARRELLFGDKVNGLKDMNDAIAQQQRVVTDLQRAEAEGVVSWTDTASAYQDLLVMYDARKKATEEQIAKEEAAKKAATEAADAQLKAINALVEALNRLADRLSTMPSLDLGLPGDQATPPSDVTQPQQQQERSGVTGISNPRDLRYETTVDSQGKVTYSKVKKFADGGHVKGPGTGTSDSIPAMLSNGEYVVPADAAKKVGLPFLESLRKGVPDVNKMVGDILPSAALSNKAASAAPKSEPTQTAIFQLGDAMIQTKANPSAVQEFQSALKVQSIKKGRRV